MFGKKASAASGLGKERFATIIGEHTHITGDLLLAEGIRIDGRLDGHVSRQPDAAAAVVVVGATGRVNGNISAGRVVVAGTVQGAIHADSDVELQASAVVEGDVHCQSLRVAHGARLVGRVLTSEPVATTTKPVLVVNQGEPARAVQKAG